MLLADLQASGCNTSKWCYLLEDLQKTCSERSTPTEVEEPEVKPGWCGKPKGMIQTLCERGCIDATENLNNHSKTGRKEDFDEEGNLTEEGKKHCLTHVLNNCADFKEELTDSEWLAKEISTTTAACSISFTPKFHCELAGEGIECSWGASKCFHRKQSLESKKSAEQFVNLVKLSVSKVKVRMVRRFARKARGHVVGYQMLHLQQRNPSSENNSESVENVSIDVDTSCENAEKMSKICVSHRDATLLMVASLNR